MWQNRPGTDLCFMISKQPTVVIENFEPLVDGGRHPIKRVVGDDLVVKADVFKDGHDLVSAVLKWRKLGDVAWNETPMKPLANDRWTATCSLFDNAIYEYTIEAWGDVFRSWRHEFRKKFEGGITSLESETLEGVAIVREAASRTLNKVDKSRLKEIARMLEASKPAQVDAIIHWSELDGLMLAWADRSRSSEYVPYAQVTVDRERAQFAAWYEFFPRSAQGLPNAGSTFRDCLPHIDDAKAMGFDVIYFPPIHPIGTTNRKGKNNSVTSEPGEPGVPYAIGNRHQQCPNGGGHRDVAPELGTLGDFDWLVGELRKRSMEVALDFAINCSPDHPWVIEHPEWFFKRPDGTIKYAENPPKKYEDVYPLNFHNENWRALWDELTNIVLFWVGHGVKTFRMDNPHTKPVAFWEYLIGTVRAKNPDVIFLSEAFTRPKMMKTLAKIGFNQSYTYFTWRNNKAELTEYFTELTQSEMREYFRGNLWPNTPDILPYFLQQGGRPAFMIRVALAATLSSVYGIYSGYELCENAALQGREEYYDSEKYQFKSRDWNAAGNIKEFITRLNRIRRENRAMHEYSNLRFYTAENENVLFYGRMTESRDNLILVVVNLDPWNRQDSFINVPIEEFGWMESDTYQVHDLLWNERYLWHGHRNFVSLDPHRKPVHIFRVRRWMSREQDFDYYL